MHRLRLRSWQSSANLDRWAGVLFCISLVLAAFAFGVGVGWYRWFPFQLIQTGKQDLVDFRRYWKSDLGIEPTRHLKPARYEGSGVTTWDQDAAQTGLTLIVTLVDGRAGAKLISMDGDALHQWGIGFSQVWHDPRHVDGGEVPHNDLSVSWKSAVLLPDGSAVFNFGGIGMVKVDVSSQVVWRLAERTHHLIHMAEDGSFWTLNRPPSGHSRHTPRPISPVRWEEPVLEESILHVSPDGQVLDEIHILDILYEAGLEGLVYNSVVAVRSRHAAITHLNDVEVLRTADAQAFPNLEPGDLMVSARNLNLILILDPGTRRIKWYHTGPWILQHDPDFTRDGRISVFDNRFDMTPTGSALGGSRIVVLDPRTFEWRVAYGGAPQRRFYTGTVGNHQQLENGNLLIAETHAGRVFEATQSGDVVWEYINRYDENRVAMVMQATRYTRDYFEIDEWRSTE